jgi:hypothetical protein
VPVERLTEVPVGALGFRIAGHLRREDYTELLLLPVRAAVERGDPVRVLVVINPSFDDLEPAALLQDLKAALDLGLAHRSAWRRFAIVPRDRSSGVVERVGLRAADPDRLTWAVVWVSSVRGQLSADPMGPVGWPAEVTYTHRTIAGALRKPRLTALGLAGP